MNNNSKLLIERPLIFILLFILLGNITYLIYTKSFLGAVVFAASFIIMLNFFTDRKFILVLNLFFLISFLNCFIYYGIQENKQSIYNVRIINIEKESIIGILRGRKVVLRSKNDTLKEGQLIKIKGKFKKKIDVETGVVGYVFDKKILDIKEDYIYKIKNLSKLYFDNLKNYLGEGPSALITSLLFGDKDNLTYEQREKFIELGIIHLICISGMHLSLIFSLIYKVFKLKYSVLICIIYVIVVGTPSSAVRALIMITLLQGSKVFFKTYDSISALSLSAIALILYKPYNLWEIGFALSYLATLGIILFNKLFIKFFYKLPKWLNVTLSLSLSAQVLTYPYMVIMFNKFSLNFIIAGVIITPIISIMLPLALLAFLTMNIEFLLNLITIPLKILIMVINGQLLFLENITIPIIHTPYMYSIAYIIMLLSFYMSYKGFNKFRGIFYSMIPILIIYSFSFITKIQLIEDKWNRAILIKKGFNRVAITNTENKFFYKKLLEKEGASKIYRIKTEEFIRIGDKNILYLDSNLSNVNLLSIKNDYDIINLNKKEYIEIYNNLIR